MRVGGAAVLVALVAAIVVGWAVGTWLGAAASAPSPDAVAVVGPPATAAPETTGTPTSIPTAEPSTSLTPATNPPPPTTILAIEGTGDEVSERFEVQEGWQIVWQTEGDAFAFAIRGDPDVGTVVDQTGPSSGVTSIAPTGRFHLEITATGPWSIEVVQNS